MTSAGVWAALRERRALDFRGDFLLGFPEPLFFLFFLLMALIHTPPPLKWCVCCEPDATRSLKLGLGEFGTAAPGLPSCFQPN